MSVKTCAKCGVVNVSSARFCTRCGAALPSVPEPEPFEEQEPGVLWRMLEWFLEFFPGLVRPKVLIMSVGALMVAGAVGYLALFLLGFGALISAMAIGGFAVVIYWTAWCWMMYGYLCMPAEAMVEFDGKKWTMLLLATAAPVAVVAVILS